jgi:hypothetical protein
MPDNLHDRDILEWSERQSDLLRQVAGSERHDDVDWQHVIEEIAAVGIAQLNDVRGLLRQAMICLVRINLNGDDRARPDWELELACALDDAADQFTPSMRQRVNLNFLWGRVLLRTARLFPGDPRGRALPDHCPWSIDDLLENDRDQLSGALAGWPVAST